MTGPFYVGETVVTRRGKRGTVTAVTASTVLVNFGFGRPLELRHGQVVSDSAYRGMNTPRPQWGHR